MRKVLTSIIVACLVGSLANCATTGREKKSNDAPPQSLVWPSPPAEPRIRYLQSVSGPRDWNIARPFWRRMLDALTGGTEEHFIRPTGVARHEGTLYVADPGANALWILDADHNRYIKVVEAGKVPLVSPVAVAVRDDGAVFLADTFLKKVFLLTADGRSIGIAAEQDLERPAGLAYDAAAQRLYVLDVGAHRVSVFAAGGTLVRTWGRRGTQDGEFNHPTHVALDRSGTVLVTDALNFRIQAFDREGRFLRKFGHHGDGSGDLAAPKGVMADRDGNVFVVDALFDAVQIFTGDGIFLLGFGGHGTRPGEFWLPNGLFIDKRNRIHVADSYNQRVQIFGKAGAGEEQTR